MELIDELRLIHKTLHVFHLWKFLVDETTIVPLKDIHIDERLYYVEKLITILERMTKTLWDREIGLVMVH